MFLLKAGPDEQPSILSATVVPKAHSGFVHCIKVFVRVAMDYVSVLFPEALLA